MPRKDLSLYVHIPFCEKKCSYCAFNSCVSTQPVMQEYITFLKKEISIRAKELGGKYLLKTVYIGGGTPSILEGKAIKDLLKHISYEFVISQGAEVTIEINPNSLTEQKAKDYMEAGVNRFSIGLQSASSALLKLLGRLHSADDFVRSVKTLKALGAQNISADIMLGLPHQTIIDAQDAVDLAIRQGVTHISTYLLELEEGTPLTRLINANMLPSLSEKESINMYKATNERLKEYGFNAYELSNYAKSQEYESKHNKVYWSRGEYLGVGLGSHSFIDGYRFSNTQKLDEYLSHLKEDKIALEYKDKITTSEATEEIIMLSLRTAEGINLSQLKSETGHDLILAKNKEIKVLIKGGYALLTNDNHLTLTTKGFMVINKIIVDLV